MKRKEVSCFTSLGLAEKNNKKTMGIKDLYSFLKKNCLEARKMPLSHFKGKTMAMDGTQYVWTLKHGDPGTWLKRLDHLVTTLVDHEITPIFVFDGPPQEAKKKEREKRKAVRKASMDSYTKHLSGCSSVALGDAFPVELKKELDKFRFRHKIAPAVEEPVITAKTVCDMGAWMEQLKRNNVIIYDSDFEDAKTLLLQRNIRCLRADDEGEKLCVYLTKIGQADIVASADGDCLALGVETLLTSIDVTLMEVKCHTLSEILEKLELTQDLFLDLCILMGTDFNENVKRFSGKNYTLLKEHGSIEAVLEHLSMKRHDVSMVKPVETRLLFSLDKQVDFEELKLAEGDRKRKMTSPSGVAKKPFISKLCFI